MAGQEWGIKSPKRDYVAKEARLTGTPRGKEKASVSVDPTLERQSSNR